MPLVWCLTKTQKVFLHAVDFIVRWTLESNALQSQEHSVLLKAKLLPIWGDSGAKHEANENILSGIVWPCPWDPSVLGYAFDISASRSKLVPVQMRDQPLLFGRSWSKLMYQWDCISTCMPRMLEITARCHQTTDRPRTISLVLNSRGAPRYRS